MTYLPACELALATQHLTWRPALRRIPLQITEGIADTWCAWHWPWRLFQATFQGCAAREGAGAGRSRSEQICIPLYLPGSLLGYHNPNVFPFDNLYHYSGPYFWTLQTLSSHCVPLRSRLLTTPWLFKPPHSPPPNER